MRGEVFQRCCDAFLVLKGRVTLKASHRCNTHLGDEERVFPKGLFYAAPARLASRIDNGRQCLMSTSGPRVFGNGSIDLFNKFRVEGRSESDGLRLARGINGGETVKALFMKDCGNAESCLFDEKPLERVRELHHLRCILPAADIAQPCYLADAVLEVVLQVVEIQVPVLIDQHPLSLPP